MEECKGGKVVPNHMFLISGVGTFLPGMSRYSATIDTVKSCSSIATVT
jgi:hypothetical protein